jgi:hypothetical protein
VTLRKAAKNVIYERPELWILSMVTSAVRGGDNGRDGNHKVSNALEANHADARQDNTETSSTGGAYEADE